MRNDIELQRDVIAALAHDASVRDENIGTTVHDGVVTLSGTVDDYDQRRAAETAATRVAGERMAAESAITKIPGIRGVRNLMEIRPTS